VSLVTTATDALAQIQALPVQRRSQSDGAFRESAIATLLARAVYDWAAADGVLFPDGNPLKLDATDPAIRQSWLDLRTSQRDIIGAVLDGWDGKSNIEFERDGVTLHADFFTLNQIDPPTRNPLDAFKIVRHAFPWMFAERPGHTGQWTFISYPTEQPDLTTLAGLYRTLSLEQREHARMRMTGYISERFFPTEVPSADWQAALNSLLSMDWRKWTADRREYWRSQQQARAIFDASSPVPGKAKLTDFLQSRLDKARLHFDASTAREQFEALPMVGARAANAKTNRTWGIELEIIDAGAIAFDAAGGWRRERDGSLRSQIGDGRTYDPWEFVSPILDQTYSQGLWMICDQAQHTVKYHKAGVHIHVAATTRKRKEYDRRTKRSRIVGGDRMTTAQMSRLIELYATVSPLLDPIIARTKTREFCVPTKVDQWADGWFEAPTSKKPHRVRPARTRKDDAIQNAKFWAQVTKGPNHDTEPTNWKRHQELNLQALNKYGTIEFRSMGAIYDYEYLTRWAWLCRAMVDFAQSDAPIGQIYHLTDFDSLARMLNARSGEPLSLGRKAA